ncbi:MAG: hypothetical protein R3B70_06470 [Polyangiaceae bacterium]
MRWNDRLKERFHSNAKAAAALRAAWILKSPEDASRVSVASLATKIGELTKGKTDWWRRRPDALQLLADLLEVKPSVLLGESTRQVGVLAFPELPALRPLQAGEEPVPLFGEGWLLDASLPNERHSHRWVFAPAGYGKSLLLRYLGLRHPEKVLTMSARTLEMASSALTSDERLLVIELERSGKDDRDAVARIRRHCARAVILSPFVLDRGREENWTGNINVGREEVDGWSLGRPMLAPGWREHLLRWVEARLMDGDRDSKLSADEVLDWLAEHDPEGSLVPSPGDLLALCRVFDAHPARSWSVVEVARRWTRMVVGAPASRMKAARHWISHCGPRVFRRLVRRQLRDRSRRLVALAPLEWEKLVPEATLPGEERGEPGARVAVSYLRDGGLLRGQEGELALFPHSAAVGEGSRHIAWLLRSGRVDAWGRWPLTTSGSLWWTARSKECCRVRYLRSLAAWSSGRRAHRLLRSWALSRPPSTPPPSASRPKISPSPTRMYRVCKLWQGSNWSSSWRIAAGRAPMFLSLGISGRLARRGLRMLGSSA